MLKPLTVGISLLVFLSAVSFAADSNAQNVCTGNPNQWRQLYNGKDLKGWKHVGPGYMTVEKDGL
ncbi:MAG TPA: hypothetical protein VKR26_12090, partial [Terriglobales bacterium]|nr:hypothetical protein [Terriglobales bacterium]